MARCLVTGHKGYIGNRLYDKLLLKGHEVHGIDLKDGDDILYCLPDEQFDEKTWVNWSQKIRENLELKNNEIFKLMRKVLTSRMFGPEMSELILILGREKIIERLKSK